MIAWLNSNIDYWHWIVLGLFLSLSEILLTSFVLLWFGLSAIIVGVLMLVFPLTITVQLFIWVLLSLFFVFGWFKWISPRLKNASLSGMARESMLGQIGTVIDYNSVQPGRGVVRFPAPILGDAEWQFICSDAIEVGNRVIVQEFSGNALIVTKVK